VRRANGQETAVNEFHEAARIRYFPLPADLAAGFSLELVLQKSETVEFLVAPPRNL